MTDPKQAHHVPGLGRYYTDPAGGPPLISVTNVLDTAMGKPALVPWAAKAVAEYAMDILPSLVVAARSDDTADAALRDLKGRVTVVREQASGLGTRVHAQAEAHLLGKTIEDDEEAAPFVEQYVAWLAEWQVDIERDVYAAETTVAHRHYGYAGTLDLCVALPILPALDGKPPCLDPDGKRHLWIVDTKTSSTQPATRFYPEAVLQQAAYRYAQVMWLPDGSEVRMPAVVGAAVLNLRRDDHALIPVPSDSEAHGAFLAALRVAKWAHEFHAVTQTDVAPRPIDPTTGHRPKRARKPKPKPEPDADKVA